MKIATAVLCALAAAAAGGCGYESQAESGGKPLALTTFTVTADMVRNVAGNRVEVASITKPGAEIHGYEPTPSDLKRGARADIVFDNGMGLERWFDQFIDEADAPRVTLTTGIRSIPIAGASDYEGKPNPHAWMSPANARVYVENIRKGLTRLDPAGAAYYRRNAERYARELTRVQEDLEHQLASLPRSRRALVSCEGAFSYLARDTGMSEHYLWPVNAEQEGTPKQVASVVDAVRRDRVPAVFCESTVSDKPQRQVARESGARFAGKLYVDSLSKPDGPVPTYLELLRRDARTIVDGLKGGGAGMTAPVVQATDVGVSYGENVALEGVDLRLDGGLVHGLIGMNGSGKSSLFKALMGLVRADRGRIELFGDSPAKARAAGRVAYVPQSEEVDWAFPVSVRDVATMGRYGRMGRTRRASDEDRRAVDHALARVDLTDLADRQIGKLSGGQRKRAFLARALAQGAELLLLDEPFAGVDKRSEATITGLLGELAGEGLTIMVSTHDLISVPALCASVALLNRRVIAQGPPAQVLVPELLAETFGGFVPQEALGIRSEQAA